MADPNRAVPLIELRMDNLEAKVQALERAAEPPDYSRFARPLKDRETLGALDPIEDAARINTAGGRLLGRVTSERDDLRNERDVLRRRLDETVPMRIFEQVMDAKTQLADRLDREDGILLERMAEMQVTIDRVAHQRDDLKAELDRAETDLAGMEVDRNGLGKLVMAKKKALKATAHERDRWAKLSVLQDKLIAALGTGDVAPELLARLGKARADLDPKPEPENDNA